MRTFQIIGVAAKNSDEWNVNLKDLDLFVETEDIVNSDSIFVYDGLGYYHEEEILFKDEETENKNARDIAEELLKDMQFDDFDFELQEVA